MATPKSTVSTEIIPYIFYRDVPAALDWLTRAFGFAETMRTATPNGGTHGEMTLDGQRIMMGQGSKEWRMVSAHESEMATQGIFIIYLAERALRTGEGCGGRDRQTARRPSLWAQLHSPRPRRASMVLHDASRRALIELRSQGLSCGTAVSGLRRSAVWYGILFSLTSLVYS
jgi:hypothetical protein